MLLVRQSKDGQILHKQLFNLCPICSSIDEYDSMACVAYCTGGITFRCVEHASICIVLGEYADVSTLCQNGLKHLHTDRHAI